MEFDYRQVKAPDFVKEEFSWCESVFVFVMKPDVHPYPKDFFVCQTGLGVDYHFLLNDYMPQFAKEKLTGRYVIQTDKFIDEKRLATCAGLGYMCKNNLFYSPKLEGFVNIGEIISDMPCENLPAEKIYNPFCEYCNKCVEACPTKALNNYTYERPKCVSFLTQKKEDFTEAEEITLNTNIYGCDICLNVCPLNTNKYTFENSDLTLDFMANMSNKEFNEIRSKYPFMWMGRKRISRNAKIVLKNKERKK